MKKSTWMMALVVSIAVVMVCGEEKQEAEKDSFFETARFIMTKQEIEIYKHLPDQGARAKYVEEFWKKRDPSPETEENENRDEFEERIAYANKWFKEYSKGRGWDTQRGRILLQLGFPDRREFGQAEDVVRSGRSRDIGVLLSSKPIPMEIWDYYYYHLRLVFADPNDTGKLELIKIPTELAHILEKAKFSIDLRDQARLRQAFKFSVEYKAGHFEVNIPVKKVSFEEKDGKMQVELGITIYVYRDSKKVDEINIPKAFSEEKEKLLQLKVITFDIPYVVTEKGKYYFDVVIEEKTSGAKFRDFTDSKI